MNRLFVIAAIALVGCSSHDAPATTVPATLTLTLSGAGESDGALIVAVSGGPVTSVDVAAGYQAALHTDSAATHVMITGAVGDGALATITIPDGTRAAAYVATVEQVADRNSFALLDPAQHRVTVSLAR